MMEFLSYLSRCIQSNPPLWLLIGGLVLYVACLRITVEVGNGKNR